MNILKVWLYSASPGSDGNTQSGRDQSRWNIFNIKKYFKIFFLQVHMIWPVLYILATVFITVVPMIAKPFETGNINI